MAILNLTPDSFSDGNAYANAQDAADAADRMIGHGAAIIDVGPESTRPGADPVPASEQIDRALFVIEKIRVQNDAIAISIDTKSASVARGCETYEWLLHRKGQGWAETYQKMSFLRDLS